MTVRLLLLLTLAMLMSPGETALAAEPVLLRLPTEPVQSVLVGQRLPITVELLTSTTFASAIAFDFPNVPGAVLMRFDDHPVLGTETVGSDSYTSQTYELEFFALRKGEFAIPAFTIRFRSPDTFGGPPVDRTLRMKPLAISARMPPGAESLPGIVCTDALTVTEAWTPADPSRRTVGDSLTRTITLSAPDVPAMVFPPIPLLKAAPLRAYAQPPAIEDRSERGDFTGTRVDTLTYICQSPGRVRLPALEIPWWNLKTNSLERATLPAVTIDIAPRPAAAAAPAAPGPSVSTASNAVVETAAILGGALVLALSIALARRLAARRAAALEGDFRHQLLAACAANDAAAADTALNRWLNASPSSAGVATLTELRAETLLPETARPALAEMERALATGTPWNGESLARALWNGTSRGAVAEARRSAAPLPPLNPA